MKNVLSYFLGRSHLGSVISANSYDWGKFEKLRPDLVNLFTTTIL